LPVFKDLDIITNSNFSVKEQPIDMAWMGCVEMIFWGCSYVCPMAFFLPDGENLLQSTDECQG
jgi:hypothetical protein